MPNGINKTISILLIAGMIWGGSALVLGTYAMFSDQVIINASTFQTGTLDLKISATTVDFIPGSIVVGATSSFDVVVADNGSILPKYEVAIQNAVDDVCRYFDINAWRNGQLVYSGGLAGFYISELTLAVNGDGLVSSDGWHFVLNVNSLDGVDNIASWSQCRFNLGFKAWQENIGNKDEGFQFSKNMPLSITFSGDLPKIKVNAPNGAEFWYAVDDKCTKNNHCRDWCVLHGMNNKCEYEITWDAKSDNEHSNSALLIDVLYSTDSGNTWLPKIASKTTNTGRFVWKIPYDNSFVSDMARIKVIATDKKDDLQWNWDQSDADFSVRSISYDEIMGQDLEIKKPTGNNGQNVNDGNNLSSLDEGTIIEPSTSEEINAGIVQISNVTPADGKAVGESVESPKATAEEPVQEKPTDVPGEAVKPVEAQRESLPELVLPDASAAKVEI